MKFNNGHWVRKKGVEAFSPAEVYYTREEGNSLVLLAPTSPIKDRGNTLEGVNLTIRISAPLPGVFRIQAAHHLGTKKRQPEFDINLPDETKLNWKGDDDSLTIYSGDFMLVVDKKSFQMSYYHAEELVTRTAPRDLAYYNTDYRGLLYEEGERRGCYMRGQHLLSHDETIYGLGERFTPFVKNGQSVDIWNADGGTSSEQAYKNIPFYLSSRGYGLFVNHPENVSFEVGSEMVSRIGFSVEGENIDYFVIDGPGPKQVLERYTDITGKPSLPAPWTFGLWLSTSFTTNYDEKTVNAFVDGMLEREIPLRVFHFDCFWMKEFNWCNFKWDDRVFPDPVGMLRRLKEKGLNICVWINPYIAQESDLFAEGMENGYFVRRTNGDAWQWDMWQPGMALVDFTNPNACIWYQDKLAALLDMGVDCFKTDFGERIPIEDVVYYDGSDAGRMHNYYTYIYNKTVFELLERKRGKGEAVLFARSATAGGQKYPVHWGGDCFSDYDSMAQSLRGGLSLTSSGFGFWSHDIGGFENTSTADVYKRWAAFGLLSTHSRLHGSSSYRIPWAYDGEAVDVVRFFARLKARLMPYLYAYANETAKTGIPMMRSMFIEFPDELSCRYLDKQYMLGSRLLVAPIMNEKGVGSYYLPEGNWTEVISKKARKGGTWIEDTYGYLDIPLLVKENTILAMGTIDEKPDYDYPNNTSLYMYELSETEPAATTVFDMDGRIGMTVIARLKDKELKITIEGRQPKEITLVNLTGVTGVQGAGVTDFGNDTVLIPETGVNEILLHF